MRDFIIQVLILKFFILSFLENKVPQKNQPKDTHTIYAVYAH